jgi:hypothetical protein
MPQVLTVFIFAMDIMAITGTVVLTIFLLSFEIHKKIALKLAHRFKHVPWGLCAFLSVAGSVALVIHMSSKEIIDINIVLTALCLYFGTLFAVCARSKYMF